MLSLYVSMVDTPEDKSFIEKLYTTYERMMYKISFDILGKEYDAEDAVHESFLNIIKTNALSKLKTLNDLETGSYLAATARNSAIRIYNRNKKNHEKSIYDYYDLDSNDSTEEHAISSLGVQEIKEALNMLSENDYEILYLLLVNALSYDEISTVLGISEDAVRQCIHRARKRLSEKLRERSIV